MDKHVAANALKPGQMIVVAIWVALFSYMAVAALVR
jgi:hypothetical protein